jgi:hypothetical protein
VLVQVEFEEKVYVDKIDIYETLNAGAVVKVSALNGDGQWVPLWQVDRPTLIQSSRIFSPTIEVITAFMFYVHIRFKCCLNNVHRLIGLQEFKMLHIYTDSRFLHKLFKIGRQLLCHWLVV